MADPTLVELIEEALGYTNVPLECDLSQKGCVAVTALLSRALAVAREQERFGTWQTGDWRIRCAIDDDLVLDLTDGSRCLCMYAVDDAGLVYLRAEDNSRISPHRIERWLRVPR